MATWCKHSPYEEDNTVKETEYDENGKYLPSYCEKSTNVPEEESAGQDLKSKIKSKDEQDDSTEEAQMLPQIYVPTKSLTYEERVALFCDQIIGMCTAEDADEAIALYINEQISNNRTWTAVWKTTPEVILVSCDAEDLPSVGVLVQVNCTQCERKVLPLRVTVSLAEPLCSNVANLPRELVEEVLKECDHSVSILDVYPVQGLGSEVDNIAEALEHARFFYDFLWRDWDDEEECAEYSGLIEKRLQLYYNIQDGTIPGPISMRYLRTLEAYRSKRLELTKFQTSICGEATPGEAVECWKKYCEMSILCGHLKFLEDLRLRCLGPFYLRVCKRRKGQRTSRKKVTHIVAQIMTADMIKNFSSHTLIQQHDSLEGALESCFSGDMVVIFPGQYQADSLASLTDDIHIKGVGGRHEVVIYSDPSHDNFVASKGCQVTLQDLTLVQKGTCDGIVVVESGQITLQNCVLKCEGTGVCVLTGASLIMTNCEVTGAQGAGIELYPGSVAELHKNEIHHCSSQTTKEPQGGISMKVLPQPQLKMSDNYIHDNNGYGLTVMVPDNIEGNVNECQELTASGDKNKPDDLAKTIQKLSLESSTNKVEANSLGEVGLLHMRVNP